MKITSTFCLSLTVLPNWSRSICLTNHSTYDSTLIQTPFQPFFMGSEGTAWHSLIKSLNILFLCHKVFQELYLFLMSHSHCYILIALEVKGRKVISLIDKCHKAPRLDSEKDMWDWWVQFLRDPWQTREEILTNKGNIKQYTFNTFTHWKESC